jgi:hypothetical protein
MKELAETSRCAPPWSTRGKYLSVGNPIKQTGALLLASGIHNLFPDCSQMMKQPSAARRPREYNVQDCNLGFSPSNTLFGRLMASIDRLLIKSAEIANRNGDHPRIDL